jgi:SAM-dependent methyltransferase
LVQARPEPDGLPEFYLWVAAGGALGGIYVTWIAPLVLRDYYELELAVLLTYALLLWSRRRHGDEHAGRRRLLWFGSGVAMPLLAAAMLTRAGLGGREKHVLDRRRSFLGALRVTQIDVGRMLTHGRIRHGMQLSDPARARWPTMYFGPGTAVAQVLTHHHQGRPRHLAVVGLGVGTLAAYGQPRDRLRFYELDPNVLAVAREWFTFLRDTPARVDVVLGDGRLALAREAPQRFDVLVLDAFASDAVPAHLLTYEAFSIYLRQLAPDGVLLANVSNRHLSVDRVVRAAARALGLACEVVETEADVTRFVSKVRWAVLARDPAQLRRELAGLTPAAPSGGDVLWTDARASVWSILK